MIPRCHLRGREACFQADWLSPLQLPILRQDEWTAKSMVEIQCPPRIPRRFLDESQAESMVGIRCLNHLPIPNRHLCSVGFRVELAVVPRSRHPDWGAWQDLTGAKLRRWDD